MSVRGVTRGQVLDVYEGKITDWRELGGSPGPIRAIGREIIDASRQAVSREITPFQTIAFTQSVKVVHLDPQMIALLDRFPTSLGFLNRSALFAASTRVVPLALDSVEPTAENLISRRYRIGVEIGLVHRPGGLTEAGQSFVQFATSAEGARILRDHDVAPMASLR